MVLPPPFDHLKLALVIIALSYAVRTVADYGSGLIAIPFLALFLPLHVSEILIALLDYMASLAHGIHGRQQVAWRLIIALLSGFTIDACNIFLLCAHYKNQTPTSWQAIIVKNNL